MIGPSSLPVANRSSAEHHRNDQEEEDSYPSQAQALLLGKVSFAVASVASFFLTDTTAFQSIIYTGRDIGSKNVVRTRTNMDIYIGRMRERSFRRKYRMHKEAFWTLLEIIERNLPNTGEKRKRGAVPNGPISKAARLSMALRYFSGGDPLDIADIHGVADDEVLNSVWDIVDAIHQSTELNISFPETHYDQIQCSQGFKVKSRIDIDCCVGCIDGMLVWMNQPSGKDQKVIGFGPTKFFCGRKKKFGLNMMGVCDSQRRFIWVEVNMPGAASDFYAFDESILKQKLESPGFLRPGLCLLGDNAYVNSTYMCTPWRNVSQGPKDSMNFFHSQVRINIECAFGILVHRWGILRKPMPVNISVGKISSLVLVLCKLHNYCIVKKCNVDRPYEGDVANIMIQGGLFLPRMDDINDASWEYNSRDRLNDLLDGGAHMDDHTESQRRQYRHLRQLDKPCHRILAEVITMGYERPDHSRERLQAGSDDR